MVSNLNVLDQFTTGNDNTSSFVASNQWKLGGQWPISIHGVKVGVAHTGVFDVDEDFIWARLRYWNLLVVDGSTGLLDNLQLSQLACPSIK